jgi:hypothetical protein
MNSVARSRIVRFATIVGVTIAVCAAAVGYGVYEASSGGTPENFIVWSWPIASAVVVYYSVLPSLRKRARTVMYWLALALAGLAHLAFHTSILFFVSRQALVLLALITPIEAGLLYGFFWTVLERKRDSSGGSLSQNR